MARHWHNPWDRARDVPLADLLDAAARYNGQADPKGCRERLDAFVRQYGDKVDPYVLPGMAGSPMSIAIGVRYGNDGPEYLSFVADPADLARLLAISTPGVNPPLPKDSE